MISREERSSILEYFEASKLKMERLMLVEGVPDLDEDKRLRQSEHLKENSSHNLLNKEMYKLIESGSSIKAVAVEYGLNYRHLQARLAKAKELGIIKSNDRARAEKVARDINKLGYPVSSACKRHSMGIHKFKALVEKYDLQIEKHGKKKKRLNKYSKKSKKERELAEKMASDVNDKKLAISKVCKDNLLTYCKFNTIMRKYQIKINKQK